jgi:hypothetical protein
MPVFREILFKGGKQLPEFDEGIIGAVRGQETLLDMDVFQKILQDIAIPDGCALFDGCEREPAQTDF